MKTKLLYVLSSIFLILLPAIMILFAGSCVVLLKKHHTDYLTVLTLLSAFIGISITLPGVIDAVSKYRKAAKCRLKKKPSYGLMQNKDLTPIRGDKAAQQRA